MSLARLKYLLPILVLAGMVSCKSKPAKKQNIWLYLKACTALGPAKKRSGHVAASMNFGWRIVQHN